MAGLHQAINIKKWMMKEKNQILTVKSYRQHFKKKKIQYQIWNLKDQTMWVRKYNIKFPLRRRINKRVNSKI